MFCINKKITNVPSHVAIIMDGNGRWAVRRHLPRTEGHRQGVEAIKRIVKASQKHGIKVLSLFAFSTENWNRDQSEVDTILQLIEQYSQDVTTEFVENNIRFRSIGNLTKFSPSFQGVMNHLTEATKHCDGLVVNVALNYGGRDEILMAVNNLLCSGKTKVSMQEFEAELQTSGLSNPDLIIRASGEQRLSNFMLFQSAYSELLFPKKLWPDFREKDLVKAIKIYAGRERRFGAIKKQEKNK